MDAMYSRACDFRLVSTYVPLLATVARAMVFTAAATVLAPDLSPHVYAAALLLVTYFDALLHVSAGSSAISGHLFSVCFVWLTRPDGVVLLNEPAGPRLALNAVWFAAVHALLASYTLRRKLPVTVVPMLAANAGLLVCHLWVASAPFSVAETHVRSACFYAFVFTHFYVFQTRSQFDAAAHACIGQHAGMHLFFVDRVFVAASLACTLCMCARVFVQNQSHHDSENPPRSPSRARAASDALADVEDMGELLEQLLAAKAGHKAEYI